MDYTKLLDQYSAVPTADQVADRVAQITAAAPRNYTAEVYRNCFAAIDLTTLDCTDSESSVEEFVRKAVEFRAHYPAIPDVASICVYPSFVETVGVGLGSSNIAITSVAGGFPASQTFIEVKMLEVAMAAESGADEVDVVINVGEMLTGDYDRMANTLEVLRGEIDDEVVLKVIVESGALRTPELIYKASLLAMMAGADFVKTSTGKTDVSATPEAAVVMCQAIRDYYEATGRKVGFKVAGGVRTAEQAALYYTIVEEILGAEWLTPSLFRIGASSLANNLISAIEGHEIKYY
ncbi:MAG: deoxyribose-phosphate aldolase [Rikenellaceae bacterium]|jgi:deoxyribose-phosphate aldolase|nr:deoxyribose-phosphate aldolase [Rikenellaceae bacterium]MBO7169293.1 deoxyribose-phosphate aldolase [Rikenellaceae bacterium]